MGKNFWRKKRGVMRFIFPGVNSVHAISQISKAGKAARGTAENANQAVNTVADSILKTSDELRQFLNKLLKDLLDTLFASRMTMASVNSAASSIEKTSNKASNSIERLQDMLETLFMFLKYWGDGLSVAAASYLIYQYIQLAKLTFSYLLQTKNATESIDAILKEQPNKIFYIVLLTIGLMVYHRVLNLMRLKGLAHIDTYNVPKNKVIELFSEYQKDITAINQLIKNRFDDFRMHNVEPNCDDPAKDSSHPNFNNSAKRQFLSIDEFFVPKTQERIQLDNLLAKVESSTSLLENYLQSIGLSKQQVAELTKHLLTSSKILETNIHSYMALEKILAWKNEYRNSAKSNNTLRTIVLTVNGKQRLYALILNPKGILELYTRDAHAQKAATGWLPLAENTQSIWQQQQRYTDTFRTEVITVDGEQKLVAMMWTPQCLELQLYDPNTDKWTPLAQGPKYKEEYNASYTLPMFRTAVIIIGGQQYLLAMLLSYHGLETFAYHTQQQQWHYQQDVNQLYNLTGHILHNGAYHAESAYSTFRVHVVNTDEEDQQKLIALICNGPDNTAFYGIHFYQASFKLVDDQLTVDWRMVLNDQQHYNFNGRQTPNSYKTFNSTVINLDNNKQCIALQVVCPGKELLTYLFDPYRHVCQEGERLAVESSMDHAYYQSLRAIAVNYSGSDKLLTMFRGNLPKNSHSHRGFVQLCLFDCKARKWIDTSTLRAEAHGINLTPPCGFIMHVDYDGDNYASYQSLQYKILEVDGEKQLVGFILAGPSIYNAPGEGRLYSYILSPKQLSLGDEVKNQLLNFIEQYTKKLSVKEYLQELFFTKRSTNSAAMAHTPLAHNPQDIKEPTNKLNNNSSNELIYSKNQGRLHTLYKHIFPAPSQPNEQLRLKGQQGLTTTYQP